MNVHRIHPDLLEGRVRITLIGCGGNGSAMLSGLVQLHQMMLAFGHPGGLHVTVWDGDAVSEANCVRQPFSQSDVGLNKAVVLVTRLNVFWGLDWEARPAHLRANDRCALSGQIVISCVDTRAARRLVQQAIHSWLYGGTQARYWLDLGNEDHFGQFVLGEPKRYDSRPRRRLPTVAELYPEIVDPTGDVGAGPSCSAMEALTRQHPFINPCLANHALALLARLFRFGQIDYHAAYVNLQTGTVAARRVPPPHPLRQHELEELRRCLTADDWDPSIWIEAFDLDPDELRAIREETTQ